MQVSKRRGILLVGGLLVLILGALFLSYYLGAFQRRVVACRILFGEGKKKTSIVFDDPAQIEDLVLRPLRLTRPDLHPADYRVLGTLVLEYEDGSTEDYWLFIPFGCYKKGQTYHVADFGKLRREIKRQFQGQKGMERIIQLIDYRP
jgi:hypothetical protein